MPFPPLIAPNFSDGDQQDNDEGGERADSDVE
jgi:hypothetical protein